MVAGLLGPTEGRVDYDGQPVAGINRKVGYMTQKDTLLPWRDSPRRSPLGSVMYRK